MENQQNLTRSADEVAPHRYQTLANSVDSGCDVETRSPRQNSVNSNSRCSDEMSEMMSPDELLVFGSRQILSLFVPVSLCMLFVVVVACTVKYYSGTKVYLPYTPFHSEGASVGTLIWQSLANAGIFIAIIVVMTVVMVLLFKYECYKFINGWLMVTTTLILFFISFGFLTEVIRALYIFFDWFSLSLIMWNFGCAGMLIIYWKGPLLIQQAYLVFISAQIALLFLKFLPQWTCWVLLAVLAVWDLVAVLTPHGPLRMLVEMAVKRNKPLFPALIYSTTATMMVMVDEDGRVTNNPQQASSHQDPSLQAVPHQANTLHAVSNQDPSLQAVPHQDQSLQNPTIQTLHQATQSRDRNPAAGPNRTFREIQEEVKSREDRGVKLGLGDFVFYSLLMGRAALDGDANTIAACYVAILIGMCLTILLLAIAGRALPALPISIFFGIVFYVVTAYVISPLSDLLSSRQIFL